MGNEESSPEVHTKSAPPVMQKNLSASNQPGQSSEAPPAYDDLFGAPATSAPVGSSSRVAAPAATPFARLPSPTSFQPSGFVNGLRHDTSQNPSGQPTQSSFSPTVPYHNGVQNPWLHQEHQSYPSIPSWQQEEEERDLRMWYANVDEDGDGHITAVELQSALLNDNWTPFSLDTINMMLRMFDKNSNDQIEFEEFAGLKRYVQEWKKVFDQYDSDHSGNIDVNEIQLAFRGMGYAFSSTTCTALCRRFSNTPSKQAINLDAFIYACAMVIAMSKDHGRNPRNMSFEEFLGRWMASS